MNWTPYFRELIAQLGDTMFSEAPKKNMMGQDDQDKGTSVGGGALSEGRYE